jgi:hypothetical protein
MKASIYLFYKQKHTAKKREESWSYARLCKKCDHQLRYFCYIDEAYLDRRIDERLHNNGCV